MKALFLLAALIAAPAFADISASSGSQSGAAAQSGSMANASQGNAQNVIFNTSPAPSESSLNVNTSGTTTSNQNVTVSGTTTSNQNITNSGASTVNHNLNTSGTSTLKTVPMVYAPPMGVTAPCRVSLSGGVSVVGFGVSGGGSVADAPCNLRELARLYHSVGQSPKAVAIADGALALECQDENVAKALGNLCPAPKPEQIAMASPIPVIQPAAIENVTPKQSKIAEADQTKTSKPVCRTEVSKSGIKTTVCSE
jgi:hypothetical protein